MKRRLAVACVATGLALSGAVPGEERDFRCRACDLKASEVERCWRIGPGEYSTGMLFNAPGTKTLLKRSSCLQELAAKYRDASLCEEVRERKSLFFDGSAISREVCERRVEERARDDPEVVIHDICRLADVEYFLNGNGRDMDIHVGFSGTYRHTYELTVAMVGDSGSAIETLDRGDRRLGAFAGELRLFFRQEQLAAAAEALGVEPPYRFRVTLALVEPRLSEVKQFALLTREERKSSVEDLIDPAALEREPRDLLPLR